MNMTNEQRHVAELKQRLERCNAAIERSQAQALARPPETRRVIEDQIGKMRALRADTLRQLRELEASSRH